MRNPEHDTAVSGMLYNMTGFRLGPILGMTLAGLVFVLVTSLAIGGVIRWLALLFIMMALGLLIVLVIFRRMGFQRKDQALITRIVLLIR